MQSKIKNISKSTWIDISLLSLLVLAITYLNWVWVIMDMLPPHWDMGRHLWTSLLYMDLLHFKTFYRMWTNYYYYPPFRYWETIPFYLIFGKSFQVAVNSNIVFTAILAFSMYGIGKKFWGRSAGFLSALFILSTPMIVGQLKEYQLDAELVAMVALSFYCLIKSNGFSDKKYSYLFGLSFGLGMLTKWTFCLCLFPAMAFVLYDGFKNEPKGISFKNPRVQNLLWTALIGLFLTLLWYGNHPRMLKNDLFDNGFKSGDMPFFSWGAQIWYFIGLERYQLFLLPFLMFLVGVFLSFKKDIWNKNKLIIVFVIGNYFLFTAMHKDLRYTMPMLVGVSVLGVFWLELIQTNWLRIGAKVLTVVYCVLVFIAMSFGTTLLPKGELAIHSVVLFEQDAFYHAPPSQEDWHQEELFKIISTYPKDEQQTSFDGLDSQHFNGWGLAYYSKLYDIPLVEPKENPYFAVVRKNTKPDTPSGYSLLRMFELPDKTMVGLYTHKAG